MNKNILNIIHKFRKKTSIKIILVFFCLFIFFVLIFKNIKKNKNDETYAVIFVPGIATCGLFNTNENSIKYDLNQNIWLYGNESKFFNFLSKNKSLKEIFFYNYKDLTCNKFGIPNNKSIKALENNAKFKTYNDKKMHLYGYNSIFFTIIDSLKFFLSENFDKNVEVFMFNYDWRLGCEKNSEKLAKIIKKYDNVILVGHSMGGLISAGSVNHLKSSDLKKIKGFISCGTPFNGSPFSLISLKTGILNFSYFFSLLPSHIKKMCIDLIINYESFYNLLPSIFFQPGNSKMPKENETIIDKNNIYFYLSPFKDNKKAKEINSFLFQKALLFYNKNFIENKWYEKIKNIYVIYGKGYNIPEGFYFENGSLKNSKYTDGDGTVGINSAFPDFLKCKAINVFSKKMKHEEIMTNEEVIKNITEYISQIFNINQQ